MEKATFLSLIRKDFTVTFEQDLDGGIGCFLFGTKTKGKNVEVWESKGHGKQRPQGCVWECVGRENRGWWEARKSGWDQIVKDFEWHTLSNKDKKIRKCLVMVLSDYINNVYSLKKIKIARYKAKSKTFPFGAWANAPTSESHRQGLHL